MTALWDQFLLSVDAKGRVSMPVSVRDAFSGDGGFQVWMNDHIALMPAAVWARYYAKFEKDEDLNPRDLLLLSSRASSFKLDPQGRLVINQRLRDLSGITKHVQFVGGRSYIGVYTPESWQQIEDEGSQASSTLTTKMATTRIV